MWWRFGRRKKSPDMGTVWDSSGPGDPGGCGLQRAVEHIFSKDRGHHEEEETHRCILHFPSMRELFTHEELEQALVQLGWKPLSKRGGWRRYFKTEEPTLPYGLPTIAKLPARSYVDAPKPIILDFVRSVNKRENRNVFCCWRPFYCQLISFYELCKFMVDFQDSLVPNIYDEGMLTFEERSELLKILLFEPADTDGEDRKVCLQDLFVLIQTELY